MKCPICQNELDVDTAVFLNSDIYHKANLIVTRCCNRPVIITPIRTYSIVEYRGGRKEDDWGNVIEQKRE